jgi:hypothetical protein
LLEVGKEVGVKVNSEKTIHMCIYHQNVGQYCNIMIANPLKMWQSSNIWEGQQQIRIAFLKKLRVD